VGNLEAYQGIDLLLESFAVTLKEKPSANLVIIGGKPADIEKYQKKSGNLNIQQRVHFLGPRPVEDLADYLAQADILVSPRVQGYNTPMKLYSYLHSGKAVLATNLPTHTQVLDDTVAMLAAPNPEDFSRGMLRLIEDGALRLNLGNAAKELIEEQYTFSVFQENLNGLYDWLNSRPVETVAV
jgi:glycosyltransferase involved in cell wall biosynthesis